MNLEKVIFGFFVLLAATLNFGFVYGDLDKLAHHNVYELFAALVVSLVADLQLIAAAVAWGYAAHVSADGVTPQAMAGIVSLAIGALLANLVSVVMLVAETLSFQRR